VRDIEPAADPVSVERSGPDAAALASYIEATFSEHQGRIYGLSLATTRDPDAAADITQEAFIRLLGEARVGRFPDNPGAWLYRTATNLAISRARRAEVARRIGPRLVRRDDPGTPEGIAIEHERTLMMRSALGRLSPLERTALVMAAQGISGEVIAAHLGKSHGATRTLLLRARRRLRDVAEREAQR
jgi:RNA polymerase sigma-70 factor (ECF subfamily)